MLIEKILQKLDRIFKIQLHCYEFLNFLMKNGLLKVVICCLVYTIYNLQSNKNFST